MSIEQFAPRRERFVAASRALGALSPLHEIFSLGGAHDAQG